MVDDSRSASATIYSLPPLLLTPRSKKITENSKLFYHTLYISIRTRAHRIKAEAPLVNATACVGFRSVLRQPSQLPASPFAGCCIGQRSTLHSDRPFAC
jgi:hypothetical protein